MTNRGSVPRIALVTSSFPRFEGDDAGIFVKRLAVALDAHGIRSTVVVPRDADEPHTEPLGESIIVRYRYGVFVRGSLAFGMGIVPNLKRSPLRALQIPLFVLAAASVLVRRRHSYDIIHANWLIMGCAAWLVSRSLGKPYVVTLRGQDARLLSLPIVGFIGTWVLRRANALTIVGESLRSELPRHLQSRALVIENGVSVDDATTTPSTDPLRAHSQAAHEELDGVRYLLFVGSVIPRKNVEGLIAILTLLRSEPSCGDLILVVAGRHEDISYKACLVRHIESLSLESSAVRFLGPIPPHDLAPLYRRAMCYVTASSYEGRPNSVLEAMYLKTPLVASRIPAHSQCIEHRVNGMLFSTSEEGAAAVREILNDAELAHRVKDAAHRGVSQRDWSMAATQYGDLYRAVLDNRAGGTHSDRSPLSPETL